MTKTETIEEIRIVIERIFLTKLCIDLDTFGSDKYNQNLLEKKINIKARHLISLYFEIEKKFNISIPEEDIVSGNFKTINNISDIVLKELLKKA